MCTDDVRTIACLKAMEGISDPEAFMKQLYKALRWLGRAESAAHLGGLPDTIIGELKKLRDFGGWEEYS